LEEADELADQIAIINEGKVIDTGTSDELKTRLGGDIVEFELSNPSDKEQALELVRKFSHAPNYDENSHMVSLPVSGGASGLVDIAGALSQAKLQILSLSLHRPSLDDVFLTLTGDKPRLNQPEPKTDRRPHQ
jgi:ABC-2 type transport system ATP-binding protein